MQLNEKPAGLPTHYIMSDQPDCCGKCGSRLDFKEIKVVDGERVFVNECISCHREILIVED